MPRLIRLDSPFYRAWSSAADLVVVNILTLLACLPVLTAGAALTACARVTMEMAREEDSYTVRTWWRSFRGNLAQSLVWWLPVLVLGALAGAMNLWLGQAEIAGASADGAGLSPTLLAFMRGLVMAGGLIVVGVLVWLVPLVAFFENTVGSHVANAARLAVGHLGRTVVCLVLLAVPTAVLALLPVSRLALGWFMVLLGVAFLGYLVALVQRRVIDALREAAC